MEISNLIEIGQELDLTIAQALPAVTKAEHFDDLATLHDQVKAVVEILPTEGEDLSDYEREALAELFEYARKQIEKGDFKEREGREVLTLLS